MLSNNKCSMCNKQFKVYEKRRLNTKRCGSCQTKIRRFICKLAAIEHLGGCCQDCGWIGNQATFEFHHTDPITKEFDIGRHLNKSWDVVVKELDKCELLCSNCHRVRHSDRQNPFLIEAAQKYNGKLKLNKDNINKYCT